MEKFTAAKMAALPWTTIGTQEKRDMVASTRRRTTRKTADKKPATRGRKTAAPKKDPQTVKAKKDADKARLAKKAEAEQKAKHTALARALKPVAKEINARLAKAETADDQATNHRVAAAIQCAKAKEDCEKDGMSFKKWCEESITDYSYNTMRQYAKIGASNDPHQAIEEARMKGAAAQKRFAERQKQLASESKAGKGKKAGVTSGDGKAPGRKVTDIEVAEEALAKLGDKGEASLVDSRLQKQGKAVVSKSDAKRLNEFKEGRLAALQEAFSFMSGGDRMKFMRWAAEQVGVELVNKTTGEAVKKTAAKKAAPKKGNAKATEDAGGERPAFLNRSGRKRRTAAGKSA